MQDLDAFEGAASHAWPDTEPVAAPADRRAPTSLDPADWDDFRANAHAALDDMIDRLASVGRGPVWRPMPADVRARFQAPLPTQARDLADVLDDFEDDIAPYVTGNTHPMFMGWVHGAGTPVGMVAEMLAAGLNANCGGRDHVGLEVERQITRWAAAMLGFPADASGLFVTGTSMANFLAVRVALAAHLGPDVRQQGLHDADGQPVAYTSEQAHGCIAQAMELAGIGSTFLRTIPVDASGAISVDLVRAAITADRAAGRRPFLLVGTAGTVNTGAFDDLATLADIAADEALHFHVDGAFGALACLSPTLRPRLAGIDRAQSVAFDFHKWAHVPYDAGFLLVRDPGVHKQAFADPPAYLSRSPRGLASGDTWPCDLGVDLSRGFRALKTWFTFQTLGADRIGSAIDHCCAMARLLEARLRDDPRFEVVAPVTLNIVCWRVRGAPDAINEAVMMDLHERGIAVPSLTRWEGRPVLRAAIVNHRTDARHVARLMDGLGASVARQLAACT